MSYSNPITVNYSRATGTTDATWAISPPRGCTSCRIDSMSVHVTTTYNAPATSAILKVGVTNNLGILGSIDLGTTAAGSKVTLTYNKGVNPLVPMLELSATTNPSTITAAQNVLECLGPVKITFVANTTADAQNSPVAGAGMADITLTWF